MSFWTPEKIAALRDLWDTGASASIIGSQIGASRNAVIGKAHRLKLERRSSNDTRAATAARKAKGQIGVARPRAVISCVRLEPSPLPRPVVTDVARVSFDDLEPHHCRFPVGEPGREAFGFCGHVKVDGLSYCADHAVRVFNAPAAPRKPYLRAETVAGKSLETVS